jgi:hypothetical protein
MLADITQDIVTKIKAISTNPFGTAPKRVGLAAGAKGIDPMMEQVTYPAAWVIYVGDESLDPNLEGTCGANIKMNFIVKVLMDYGTEADLISGNFPLLEQVINGIHGQDGPLGAKRWKYEGQTLDELTGNRMIFDQRYSIVTIL